MRTPKQPRGQSMVEFALIVPVFVLLLVGIFDFGRAVYGYSTINNAAREAARLAIVDQTVAHIQAEGAGQAATIGILAADVEVDFRAIETPDTPDSCAADIPGDDNNTGGIVFCVAVVTVPYDYEAVTPMIGALVGPIQLIGESSFKVDFNCEGAECPLGE